MPSLLELAGGGGPGTADRFYLPEGFYRRNGLEDLLPVEAQGHAHLIDHRGQVLNLAQMRGRAGRPQKPVVLRGADGVTPILIATGGALEAAEVEELALGLLEKQEAKLRRGEPIIDFDRFRAEHGYVPRERFSDAFKQALQDRMEQHRRNPVTDPAPVRCDRPGGNVYGYTHGRASDETTTPGTDQATGG